jgi:hypothetical protein
MTPRLDAAFAAIDAANADDPHTIVVDGIERPKEQTHAELMVEWVRRLDPDASEEQLVAARAHHLRRWETPRSAFPAGRAGYLRWRAAAKARHAEEVRVVLASVGYPPESIERVASIVRKDDLARDPAVQVHEDALCLVFLSTQLDEIIERLGEAKTIEVVARTAAKMSPTGLEAAASVDLSETGQRVLRAALGG